MSEVARKAVFNLAAKSAVTAFTIISFLYLGRSGEAVKADVAVLAFALSFVGTFTFIFDMGYGNAHIKRVSEGCDEGRCNATFIAIRLALTATMVAATIAAIFVWERMNPDGAFSVGEQRMAVFVILAYYVFFALAQIPVMTFNGRLESAKQQIPETVGTMARAPIIIYVVMAGLGAVALSMSYLVTGLVMCVMAFWLFRGSPIGKADKEMATSYTKYAAPLMPLLLVTILSQNLPPVLIAFFTGDAGQVAGFFMMQRLTMVFILVSTSMAPVLFPKLSREHARKDMALVRDLCRRTERLISLMMVPLVFATVALAPALIHIFLEDSYLTVSLTMRILAVYSLVISLDMAYVMSIYGIDRPDVSLRLGLATACVTIAGFFILIPLDFGGVGGAAWSDPAGVALGGALLEAGKYVGGASGAAWALLMGGMTEYAVSRHYAKKLAGITSHHRTRLHVASGLVMAAFLFACYEGGFVERWYGLLAASAAGLAIYLGLLAAAKEFGRRDVDFFMDTLNVRKMLSYLSSELRGKK
jgi:O-antigen/teichoic acid export membrane protein